MNITKDVNGKPSSKRIAGFICLGFGIALLVAAGICSFFFRLADPSTTFGAGSALIGVGGTLLGLTIGEKKQEISISGTYQGMRHDIGSSGPGSAK